MKAASEFTWNVNLSDFSGSHEYDGYFSGVIDSENLPEFEKKFRSAVKKPGIANFAVAGEVCFWKNYYSTERRERLTYRTLRRFSDPVVWNKFAHSLKKLAGDFTIGNFSDMRHLSGFDGGFAIPLTFLSFYDPDNYPMTDRHIGRWWNSNKRRFGYSGLPDFVFRSGVVSGTGEDDAISNYNAYKGLTGFCRDYSSLLEEKTGSKWRAADVEKAIFNAQINGVVLSPLTEVILPDEGIYLNFSDYNPEGSVLILTIDSFHKSSDKEKSGYSPEFSIAKSGIGPESVRLVMENRAEIYGKLKSNRIVWDNFENEIINNDDLRFGPDFSGGDDSGEYLPAVFRYNGDFYDGLDDEGRVRLLSSDKHFLIISACYGLLSPFEYVQNYSCQFGSDNAAYWQWTKNKTLSKILADYVTVRGIKLIFDFTDCDVESYHRSIDWEYVEKETGVEILHCYHEWAEGDKALKFFGEFVNDVIFARSDEDILNLDYSLSINNIHFSRSLRPDKEVKPKKLQNLQDIIDSGERDTAEFKTSIFWSENPEKTVDDKRFWWLGRDYSKFKIARNIVSFLNSNGGNLIIGVKENPEDDSLKIVGIESEFSKLDNRNKDGYRRKIVDEVINKMIYPKDVKNHFSRYFAIDFHEVRGEILCWIQVFKSEDVPFYVVLRDNNHEGRSEELFYIREDSSSVELSPKHTGEYIMKHFCRRW
ncbi:AlbA family DNA-binding domain-containing protein [Methanoplanus endosymbiosus]|uniref:Peroxide stress protein YaaA n=1 Tax=Methanoplanus endosymbiosus TaxID=33865 RepID=A0A9E7PNP8_9EURY|nr:peroxide stress protein YaaA [Methanoplanus endosymbiosus]UUX93295.1 peroxide stress protein YaaA [Methanoplanus endosymbiosus]